MGRAGACLQPFKVRTCNNRHGFCMCGRFVCMRAPYTAIAALLWLLNAQPRHFRELSSWGCRAGIGGGGGGGGGSAGVLVCWCAGHGHGLSCGCGSGGGGAGRTGWGGQQQ